MKKKAIAKEFSSNKSFSGDKYWAQRYDPKPAQSMTGSKTTSGTETEMKPTKTEDYIAKIQFCIG